MLNLEPNLAFRCAALDQARTVGRQGFRCPLSVDVAVGHTHCRVHAALFDDYVHRYKQVQAELERVTDGAFGWAALDALLHDDQRMPSGSVRVRKVSRLLLQLTKKRVLAETLSFYGDPRRVLPGGKADLGPGLVPDFLRAVQEWPDPAAQPDPGHVAAIRKYHALYVAARARARADKGQGQQPPPSDAGNDGYSDADEDADFDTADMGIMIPGNSRAGAGPGPGRASLPCGAVPTPVPRQWTELERGLLEVYWLWARHVAREHPLVNLRATGETAVQEMLKRLFDLFKLCPDAPHGVLVAVERLGVRHARLFLGDLAWRQMINSATMAERFCREVLSERRPLMVSKDCPILAVMVASASALAHGVRSMLLMDSRRTKRTELSGAIASHRCAVALLTYLRAIPIAQRGSLGAVFSYSSHAGALVLAAACTGRCGPDDATGMAWWSRFHEDPHGRLDELVDALRVTLEVAMRKERERQGGRPMPDETLQAVCDWIGQTDGSQMPPAPTLFAMVLKRQGPMRAHANSDGTADEEGPRPV